MGFGKFAEGTSMFSATPVENLFMLEFMPNAPGDFVRVYLFGLMQCHYPEIAAEGITGIAKALNLDEETVRNACRYWEREGLIVRMSDNPPTYEFHSCREAMDQRPQVDKDYYENRDFTASLQNLFGADQLLHPKEYTMIGDWVEVYRLPQDVILFMVRQELSSSEKKHTLATTFKHLEKTARELADREIRTVEEAEAFLNRDETVSRCASNVLDVFGYRRAPAKPELELMKKWIQTWNFAPDAVIFACENTSMANPSFKYIDKILENLRSMDGTHTTKELLIMRMGEDQTLHEQIKQLLKEMKVSGAPSAQDRECYERIMQAGFDFEVVLQGARSGKLSGMVDLEVRMFKWAEQGIFTVEQYEAFRQRRALLDRSVQLLFDRAGIERKPRQADRDLMEKWQEAHGMDMILLAGERSRGTDTPMRYIGGILSRWQKTGIRTPEQAETERQRGTANGGAAQPAGNFMQREYKEDDFKQGFFVEFEPEDDEEGSV